MKVSHKNSIDYLHSTIENRIQMYAKLGSLLCKILSSSEKRQEKCWLEVLVSLYSWGEQKHLTYRLTLLRKRGG